MPPAAFVSSVDQHTVPGVKLDGRVPAVSQEDPISILLVDDAPEKLLALEAVLLELNHPVVKASSGREALRLLLRQRFALIVLDVNMPGMDGFETATLIRQRPSTAATPIIFVTSFSTAEVDVNQGYSLGAVDYLFTPVSPELLRSKVSVFLQLEKSHRELQRQALALRRAEEEKLQRQLDETNARLEWEVRRNHFFRLSIELLAISDYSAVLKQTNPTWEKLLGYPPEALQGKCVLDFVHPDDQAEARELLSRITSHESSLYFENRFRAADGRWRWLAWTVAPFAAEGLLYIFARDITERHERERQIRELNADLSAHAQSLQAMNQEMEVFCYSIAHDLRAPVLAMRNYAEILLGGEAGELPSEAEQLVRAVSRNSERMTRLIDDFLSFFRIRQQEIKREQVDMDVLVKEAVTETLAGSAAGAVEFSISPLRVAVGDAAMIRQVLINLISNAVKFTRPREQARVEIGCVAGQAATTYFVKDNGVGFEMKYAAKLFGVFQRLHARNDFEGTGVGLAIVQKIVQRHGGRIWAEAQPDRGATFFFTLNETPAV